jgi:predicted transcriptional regulator
MSSNTLHKSPGIGAETEEARAARIRREAALIAQAHADIDAGLGIEEEELEAWLDQLEIDENTPLPAPKAQASSR